VGRGGGWKVNRREESLAKARKHLRRVLDELESAQLQLLGIQLGLRDPVTERIDLEDKGDETDPVAELEVTIACVLNDSIRPALKDLQDALVSPGSKVEES
jgi:hypothetical protein